MKFQLRTLLIVTTLTAVCIGVFVSHQNSITQVQAIEKKVDSLLEDTILDMKTQWIAESREPIESDPAYQGKKISEEVIHVFRGSCIANFQALLVTGWSADYLEVVLS